MRESSGLRHHVEYRALFEVINGQYAMTVPIESLLNIHRCSPPCMRKRTQPTCDLTFYRLFLLWIIQHSCNASLGFQYHSAFGFLANKGNIRAVTGSTMTTNVCAIHSISGELFRLRLLQLSSDTSSASICSTQLFLFSLDVFLRC